jgi:hypothetical protein
VPREFLGVACGHLHRDAKQWNAEEGNTRNRVRVVQAMGILFEFLGELAGEAMVGLLRLLFRKRTDTKR